MTIHADNKSTKAVLLQLVGELHARAGQSGELRRKVNLLVVAHKLKTLANGKHVEVLLNYME